MGDLYLTPQKGEETSRSNRIPMVVPLVLQGAGVAQLVLLLRHLPIVTLRGPPVPLLVLGRWPLRRLLWSGVHQGVLQKPSAWIKVVPLGPYVAR